MIIYQYTINRLFTFYLKKSDIYPQVIRKYLNKRKHIYTHV